ncbi:UNVERIFIED_CONTAM: hypothetical protein FKN15_035627 [Acipenser sinensis]
MVLYEGKWWKINGRDIDLGMDYHYSLVEGNLLINNPDKNRHGGTYQCFASNSFGTIVSREANVQFAYLENFNSKLRNAVPVREGQAVVLLCGPPPHSGDFEHLQWVQTLKDSYMAIEDTLFWECKASGKPNPMYRWLKNGDPLVLEIMYLEELDSQ